MKDELDEMKLKLGVVEALESIAKSPLKLSQCMDDPALGKPRLRIQHENRGDEKQ